jgi:hypothetical protein
MRSEHGDFVDAMAKDSSFAPELGNKSAQELDSTPFSPIEDALAELWALLSHLLQVTRDDNFFLIGRDSPQGKGGDAFQLRISTLRPAK